MKEYNRKTRKWENPVATEQVGDLKKRDTCRAKKPHDFKLVLPKYLQAVNPDVTDIQIENYYESKDRGIDFENAEKKFLQSIGINSRYDSKLRPYACRYYECTVCHKEDWKQEKL